MTDRTAYRTPRGPWTIRATARRFQAIAVAFVSVGIFSFLFPSPVSAQEPERYQQVRILLPSADALPYLPSLDDHAAAHQGEEHRDSGIVTLLSESDVQTLREHGVQVTVLIPDLQRFYAERAAASMQALEQKKKKEKKTALSSLSADADPVDFTLGSVAGYYTPEELYDQLRRMRDRYPDLVSEPVSIGKSAQGRDLWGVRISARPESDAPPEALYTGMHHAREPISMMCLVYTMWSLLEGYGQNPETTGLLESRALWFVPLVNPDGYAYNVRYFPDGGGLWRKNRSGADEEGVDLNRNYGLNATWLTPPDGGTDDPMSGSYRGPAPFSEPETRALRDFVLAHDFRTALNFHSYSNVLIYKHGGSVPEIADTAWYVESARELALENGLGHGRGAEAIGYEASGTADEWMFHAGNRRIFSWTPEVGSVEDGFWPAPDRITILCRRMVPMSLRTALMAGPCPRIVSWNAVDTAGAKELELTVSNIGVEAMGEEGEIEVEGFAETVAAVPTLAPGRSSHIRIILPDGITQRPASRGEIPIRIRYASNTWRQTVRPLLHPLFTLFSDDFESSLSSWNAGLWDVETAPETGRVLSDSPYENYFETDIPNVIELAAPVSLAGYDAAELQFRAKAVIRGTAHSLVVEAREYPGAWQRLDAEYLQTSSESAGPERSEFRGGNREWANYSIPLDRFAGRNVQIRFVMRTPYTAGGPLYDGALIDDLRIVAARPRPLSVAAEEPAVRSAPTVWPNPFRDVLHIQPENRDDITVRIFDLLGREIADASGMSVLSMNTQDLPSGTYILSIRNGTEAYRLKVLKKE